MRKRSVPVFAPLSPLAVAQVSGESVQMRSRQEVLEVTALSADVFRLRIARAKIFSLCPSWAVVNPGWAASGAQIRTGQGSVSVQTAAGQLRWHLASGAWELLDRTGARVFSAAANHMGFIADGAQVIVNLQEDELLFGLGETTGPFNKRGLHRIFWNIDVLGHAPGIHPDLQSLYLSVPFAVSLRAGRAAGLFWDNPARQQWDLGLASAEQWRMQADSGEINLYLFIGPNVREVVSRFTELTGRIPLPPLWGLGYHQCRFSYESRAEVEKIARTFRRKKIPCDAIYLDIDHMNGYRVFTFGKTFPKPAQFIARLARQGFKLVTIVDPGVKNDPRFAVFKRGRAQRVFVKEPSGKRDYIGRVWPGESRFPDFTNARTREWWGREQARLQQLGIAGFWNDMNEPANFALPSKTLPENCRHRTDFGPATHGELHNVYGAQMARASRAGALAQQPNARPFIITRAGYAGLQRHALVWTGDNSSTWEHLADSLQMLLNLGLSGVPFCGADVGGFLGDATGELLARWTQLAAFTPFFRNHSNKGTHRQEPWAFGPRIERICKRYITLRYQLLPYLYLCFLEAHRTGAPIMRPLLWHYQDDPVAVAAADQFLVGKDLLVAPILHQGAVERSVYLPRGFWYDFWTGQVHEGARHILAKGRLETIPLYARSGAIIPMVPVGQSTDTIDWARVELHVWKGREGGLLWYEDDGHSLAYQHGEFHERGIQFFGAKHGLRLNFSETQGRFPSQVKVWRVVVHGIHRSWRATVNGRPLHRRFAPQPGLLVLVFPSRPSKIAVRVGLK